MSGCPRCHSTNVQPVNQYETTTTTKGFGCCKGFLGFILFGWVGWLCGLIGMGKSKTRTTTNVLWACNSCGRRFK
ncbi:MAG: hypothetical protein FWD16_05865 [Clostridia bacterium]|nr:hypothetical protein [Clostridia bacterium]